MKYQQQGSRLANAGNLVHSRGTYSPGPWKTPGPATITKQLKNMIFTSSSAAQAKMAQIFLYWWNIMETGTYFDKYKKFKNLMHHEPAQTKD